MQRLERVNQDLDQLDTELQPRLAPYQEQLDRLCQIPGINQDTAAVIIAELGVDMSVFPTAEQVAAWAGLCPGNNESAGRSKRAGTRKGNVHLKTALVTAAVGAAKKKGSYLRGKFFRLAVRMKPIQAHMAVAHKILISAYYMLKHKQDYKDLGEGYLDRRKQKQAASHLVRRLEQMGYQVQLAPKAA